MLGRLALAAAASLLPAAASAQNADKPIAEAAADLAYGYCPLFLAGAFELTGNPVLTDFGFGSEIDKRPHPRFGEMQTVEAKRADGELGFGGVPQQVCQVIVAGPSRAAALAMLRKNLEFMGLDFKPDPENTGERGGARLETFKAPVDGQMLYVQLVDAAGPSPAVIAQLFGMEK